MSDVTAGGRYLDDYEVVGTVGVSAGVGGTATDPEVKRTLGTLACRLGGELIVPLTSATMQNKYGSDTNQYLSFFLSTGER